MMHAKTVAAFTNAMLIMDHALPAELAVAHFRAGALLPALLRLSNASHVAQPDSAPDMRGIALRIALPGGRAHDLLFTNSPTFIAGDARQFLAYFLASHGDPEQLLGILAARLGEREALAIAARLKASFRLCPSLACESFWSCGALLWDDAPARLKLIPLTPSSASGDLPKGHDGLRTELARRLAVGDVRFRFAVQRYVDARRTPVEDAGAEWSERIAPPTEIATLVIPRQHLSTRQEARMLRHVETLEWNPWNAPPAFRPLGSINRLRRILCPLIAEARQEDG